MRDDVMGARYRAGPVLMWLTTLSEQVFINQKFIGGGDETVKLKNSGELQKMLTAQPVAA